MADESIKEKVVIIHGNSHKFWPLKFITPEQEKACYDNMIKTLNQLTKKKEKENELL